MRPYYPLRRFRPTHDRPFALQPLLDAMGNGTGGQLQRRLGLGGRDVRTMREEGLTFYQADTYATRLGLHPGTVWPEWWAA